MRRWWSWTGLALLAALWIALRSSERDAARPDAPAVTLPAAGSEALPRDAPSERRDAETTPEVETLETVGAAQAASDRPRGSLTVDVVDANEAAAAAVRVEVRFEPSPGPDLDPGDALGERGHSAETGAEGRAEFERLVVGRYAVRATREGSGETLASASGRVRVDEDGSSVRLVLGGPPTPLVVSVRDRSRAQVAGAAVELSSALGEAPLASTSDERGEARFADPPASGFVLVARKGELCGTALVWTAGGVSRATREGVTITVDAPAKLSGSVLGLAPELVEGARVLARLLDNAQPYYSTHGREESTTVAGGRYAFEALPGGTYTLALVDPRGARLDLPRLNGWGEAELADSVDPLEVELAAGASVVLDLRACEGALLEGNVRSSDGKPLAGATVRVTLAPRTSNVPDGYYLHGVNVWRFDASDATGDHPDSHWRARTDADGRYRFAGLPAGRVRVEVALGGWSFDRREEVELRARGTTALEHRLCAAGAIEGVDRSGGYVGVQPEGSLAVRAIAVLPGDGLFRFPGLEPGRWTLSRFHSDTRVAPVRLLEVSVVAGATTWVDLDRDGERPIRISGRVVDANGPVAGARVRFHPLWVTTDAGGRFETRVTFPLTMWDGLLVERDGVRTRVAVERMEPDQREWEGEVALADGTLLVRAFDARGAPSAARFDFQIELAEQGAITEITGENLAIDRSGERVLRGLAPGTLRMEARFPDGSKLSTSCKLPREEPLDLRALATGSLTVSATLPDGMPAHGYALAVWTWNGEGAPPADLDGFVANAQTQWTHFDREGKARFAAITAGELWIRAYDDRGRVGPSPDPVDVRRTLAPGETLAVAVQLER